MNMSCQRCLCRTCQVRKKCLSGCVFQYGCESVVTKCQIRDKEKGGMMKRLNDEYLKTKAKWAKILNVIPEAPKAPGMTDAEMMAMAAVVFVLLVVALVMGATQ